MRLKDLIDSLDGCRVYNFEDFSVEGISCNSREVSNSFIFVAVKGSDTDGHFFITAAIEKGAKAVVVDASRLNEYISHKCCFIAVENTHSALVKLAVGFYGNQSLPMKVIGVTGTNGKTTVTYLIEALLKEAGRSLGVIGTINYRFKDKIITAKNTTPGPLKLQSIFADMRGEKVDYVVMEVSSHALAQERVEGINFHSALFTNLTQDHLDYHKTMDDYFRTKARLFENLGPGAFAVINNDDRYGRLIKNLTKRETVTYGIENDSDLMARDINFDISHTSFVLDTGKEKINLETNLVGRYNIYNILAAVAFFLKEGFEISFVKSVFGKKHFVPGRLERIDFSGEFSVFVDYAHTEDALRNVINTLRQVAENRIIVVFGCGGERDKTKRPKMGHVVSELADCSIITSDNPRSEDPLEIIEDIKRGIVKENYYVVPDRLEAIKKSLSIAKSGDLVLIAGKGQEDSQIFKDRVIHFDDKEVVRECLRSMNY